MLAMAMCNLLLHQEQLKCVPGLAGLPKAWPLRHSGAGVLSPSSPASPPLSSLSPLFLWPSQPSLLDELFFSLTCYPLRGLISFSLPFLSTSVSSLHPKPRSTRHPGLAAPTQPLPAVPLNPRSRALLPVSASPGGKTPLSELGLPTANSSYPPFIHTTGFLHKHINTHVHTETLLLKNSKSQGRDRPYKRKITLKAALAEMETVVSNISSSQPAQFTPAGLANVRWLYSHGVKSPSLIRRWGISGAHRPSLVALIAPGV